MIFRLAMLAALLCSVAAATAQNYPNAPIRFVVPFGDGQSQALTRLLSGKMEQHLKVPVVVETRAGAGGAIGTEAVVRAKPDGYTIGFGGTMSLLQPLRKEPPYDPIRDLAAIAFTALSAPPVVLVRPSFKGSVRDLLAEMRKREGGYNWTANNGAFAFMAGLQFLDIAKANVQYIPVTGEVAALQLLLNRQKEVEFAIVLGTTALPYLEAGTLRGVLVLSNGVNPSLPGMPTMKDAGLEGFVDLPVNNTVFAPAGTPEHILETLRNAIRAVRDEPDFVALLRSQGSVPLVGERAEIEEWLRQSGEVLAGIVRKNNIQRH